MKLSNNHKNIIYYMIDITSSFDVTSVLQSNLELSKNFTGFTNYLNVISNNTGTNASVPNIFGGYDFNPYYKKNKNKFAKINFRKYMNKAISVLINSSREKGWDISCVSNQYYHYNKDKSYWYSNWETLENDFKNYNIKSINAPDISKMLYKYYPEIYKSINLKNNTFLYDYNNNDIAISNYLSHIKIENTNKDKIITIIDESLHFPNAMNENGKFNNFSDNNIKNIYNSVIGFIKNISNFINHLKNNRIYDNTMIIIVSDHGNTHGNLPIFDKKYNFSNIDYSDLKKITKKYGNSFLRHFPTMLIKPFNKTNNIQYENKELYTTADSLTFIKENNPMIEFKKLDSTEDIRYLKKYLTLKKEKIFIFIPTEMILCEMTIL